MRRHCIDTADWKENILQRYLDRGQIQAYEARPSENVYFAAHQLVVGPGSREKLDPLLRRLGAKPVADAGVLPRSPERPSNDKIVELALSRAPARRAELVRKQGDQGVDPVEVPSTGVPEVFEIDARVSVAELVLDLRDSRAHRGADVGLNHVVTGLQVRRGFPDGDPEPIDEPFASLPGGEEVPGHGVGVAVVDTGFPIAWPADVDWFDRDVSWRPLPGETDHVDLLDDKRDGFLDPEAGHGVFVAGMVRRIAPAATLWFLRALNADGMGTEIGVARAIRWAARRPIQVLNLSLGFYSLQNATPSGIVAALDDARRARPGLAVVAAAGNDGTTSPTYPAALKRVVAVGALDGARSALASFSNRGPWVDVNAPGTWQAAPYVEGVEDRRITRDGNSDRFAGRAVWNGTSFACGTVSGMVAAAIGKGTSPEATAVDVLGALPPTPGAHGALADPAPAF